jgi:hypothetical protein
MQRCCVAVATMQKVLQGMLKAILTMEVVRQHCMLSGESIKTLLNWSDKDRFPLHQCASPRLETSTRTKITVRRCEIQPELLFVDKIKNSTDVFRPHWFYIRRFVKISNPSRRRPGTLQCVAFRRRCPLKLERQFIKILLRQSMSTPSWSNIKSNNFSRETIKFTFFTFRCVTAILLWLACSSIAIKHTIIPALLCFDAIKKQG